MSVIVYGPRRRSVHAAWGAVPATSAMPVSVRVDGIDDVSGVLWSVDGAVIAESGSPDARLNLTPLRGKRTLSARCQLGGSDDVVTVTIPMRLRAATTAEQSLYAGAPTEPPPSTDPLPTNPPPTTGGSAFEPPAYPEEAGRGCLVPRSSLTVITGAQASNMKTIDKCLILGRVATTLSGTEITNSRIEAITNVTGGSGITSALLARNGGSLTATNVTVSGLQRDAQGRPEKLHMVNRGVIGGVQFNDGIVEYVNDGVEVGSGTTLRRTAVVRHTSATVGGDSQHPDGAQGQQGGGVLVEDVFFDGTVNPAPTLPDGSKIPGTVMRGAAGLMLNHDRAWSRQVVIRRCIFATTASVGLNIAGGAKPRIGDPYPDGLEWWVKRYDKDGNLIAGVLVEDCEWRGEHKDFMIRARKAMLYENFPAWGGSRQNSAGASTWGRYRNPDGSYRDLPPAAIYGT